MEGSVVGVIESGDVDAKIVDTDVVVASGSGCCEYSKRLTGSSSNVIAKTVRLDRR